MKLKKNKYKRLTENEVRSIRRRELFGYLLPLIKSFGAWIVGVFVVALDYTSYRWFSMAFVHFTTYLSYGISKILFIPVQLTGSDKEIITTLEVNFDMIVISGYPMKIELECSAYHAYIAVIALVAFSVWKRNDKLIYGSNILAVLAILNSLRIIMLGVVGHDFPAIFNIMHDYVWNILLVIILWGLWEMANNRLTKTT